ncbi:D-alanyl-D-alanine dipeptidase [Alphaproteobacteria bacterium]|nr:D-alanyl-D-alanine dipeptidase [Alphaproteobacteria bacterium]
MKLIEITEDRYDISIELAYAKKDNVTGKKIYKHNRCFIHQDAEKKLLSAIFLAKALGYKFKVFDAYRPSPAQEILWKFCPDKNFITPPNIGSPHSRGIAIDLTLMKNNKTIDMGTSFDYLYEESHHANIKISVTAQKNRLVLLGIMTASGWDFYKNEWWHYQLHHSKTWPLINNKAVDANIMGK